MVDLGDLVKLPNDAYTDLVKPAAKQIGKTIELPFRAINAALTPLEKWLIHREHSLEETKQLLAKRLANIPEEKIVSPEPYIAVPALQAISYCMDCADLRELFANLLATSMNKDTKTNAHPAFVEIIKQLNPIDAQFLKASDIADTLTLPLCSLRFQKKSFQIPIEDFTGTSHPFRNMTSGFYHLRNFAVIPNLSVDIVEVSSSLDNIQRLGIVELDYNYVLTDTNLYLSFVTHPYLEVAEKGLERYNQKINGGEPLAEVALLRGTIRLTDFGATLCRAIF
jgi:hypothetical protein